MAVVEIDQNSIKIAVEKIKREYSQISGNILDKAISNALNRAAQQCKTAASREIRRVYNVSAQTVNSSIKVRYSQPRTLTARVVASGRPLSLTSFGAKQETATERVRFDRRGNVVRTTRKTRKPPTSGVSFEVKRGEKSNLPTAFIQTANGGTTVFARGVYKGSSEGFEFTKPRLPIAKMTSLSIPMMFLNDDVMKPVTNTTGAFFMNRIEHEINFLMSK